MDTHRNVQHHDRNTLTLTMAGDAYEYYLELLLSLVGRGLALSIDGQDVSTIKIEHNGGEDIYGATEASILAHPYAPERGYDHERTVSIPLIRDSEVVVHNVHLF